MFSFLRNKFVPMFEEFFETKFEGVVNLVKWNFLLNIPEIKTSINFDEKNNEYSIFFNKEFIKTLKKFSFLELILQKENPFILVGLQEGISIDDKPQELIGFKIKYFYLSESSFEDLVKFFKIPSHLINDAKKTYEIAFLKNKDYFKTILLLPIFSPFRNKNIIGVLAINSKVLLDFVFSPKNELKFEFFYKILSSVFNSTTLDEASYLLNIKATKSALAAIMARNMSHNIGSHVISDIITSPILEPWELKLNFFRYLQHRMDFIAQITTEIPQWTYPAWFHKEIMRDFYNQFILLDRIGISEGLRAYNWPKSLENAEMRGKIIIRTATQEANTKSLKWIVNEYKSFKNVENENNIIKDDFQIAIPGANIGYHAIYTIIEGFLRNIAKHNYLKRHRYNEDLLCVIDGKCKLITNNEIKHYRWTENLKKILKILEVDQFNSLIIAKTLISTKNNRLKTNFTKKELETIKEKMFILLETENDIPPNPANEFIGPHFLTPFETNKIKIFINENKINDIRNYLSATPLRINIKIQENEQKDFYWITIWSDIPHKWDDFENININENKKINAILPVLLNEKIEKTFIDKVGNIKKENWGLQEIKISASFLQMRNIEELGINGSFVFKEQTYITDLNNLGLNGYPKGIIKFVPVDRNGNEIGEEKRDENGFLEKIEKKEEQRMSFYFLGLKFWVKKSKEVMFFHKD